MLNTLPKSRNLPNGFVVECSKMIGMEWFTFTVWVPGATYFGSHSHIKHVGNGELHGNFATAQIPKEIDDIPYGLTRSVALDKWHNELREKAYEYIFEAYPELKDNPNISMAYSNGQVDVWPKKA